MRKINRRPFLPGGQSSACARGRSILKKSLLILLCLLSVACDGHPDYVLSKGKMKRVLYDYHLAQAMLENLPPDDSTRNHLIQAVFQKYNITQADFDSSMVWYTVHSSDLKDIYDDLREAYTADAEELQLTLGSSEMGAIITEGGDTTNLWHGQRAFALRPRDILSLEKFTIKADTSFHPNDHFILIGKATFLDAGQNQREHRLSLSLSVINTKGETFSDVRQLTSSDNFRLEIGQAFDTPLRSVTGFFFYQAPNSSGRSICIVDGISLIRMHRQPPQPQPADSLDSAKDSTDTDSAPERQRGPRLSPQELRKNSTEGDERIKIKKMPDVRTPNSFGPSRRRRTRP